jgi:sarcosine oxidase subunit gamma
VHDLAPLTALGGTAPRHDAIGGIAISEVTDLALASVAARQGRQTGCIDGLTAFLGTPLPPPGEAATGSHAAAIWMAPDQWMLTAAETGTGNDMLADTLKARLGDTASVTEQTDGWVCLDVRGGGVVDLFERLCPVPARRMQAGAARRSTIDHLGCFVICTASGAAFRVLGPRSAAASLHHALCTAARSIA